MPWAGHIKHRHSAMTRALFMEIHIYISSRENRNGSMVRPPPRALPYAIYRAPNFRKGFICSILYGIKGFWLCHPPQKNKSGTDKATANMGFSNEKPRKIKSRHRGIQTIKYHTRLDECFETVTCTMGSWLVCLLVRYDLGISLRILIFDVILLLLYI